MAEPTLALDIGGTKIAVGLVDDDGSLLHRAQLPTPDGDPESIWAVVDSLLTESLAAAGGRVRGVGIASAGPIDLAEGTVSPINIVEWQRFPIVERVSTTVGAPTRLGGDGLCMALGERWRGAGRGADFLLGMVVSTGVGGGLVLDGAPYDGRTGNAGHVGHVVVEPDGAACTCGGRGCVETIAAGPRMVEWARSQGWVGADAKELADAAAGGDAVALRAYRRGATAVAAMIASVGAVCDLDRVVIGGGVAKAGALLFEPLREALASYAGLSFLRDLQVLPAELGGDAGLVGAAALVREFPA
ncbi:ROK family protein [Mycolicibacterium phlei]|uniref:ROK family protein n=1 Tax=Mycolicibacterium phlei TaxID=1771 RepID=UPI00025AF472|nr:ROK family protein [Mycolicibacterium phlei]EID16769.1 transcriptional regulator/sugar kinase [Mycolicibacterium phlei RIVM601174]MBF4190702.1 transcriptional regulator/sugar kinase [Mycolicibacterium phlei]